MSGLHIALRLPLADFVLQADLALPGRGVTALFGPSGSGKTTLLRCVAGLVRGAGRVEVNGDVWQDDARRVCLPTHRRPLGYVFQEASLFEHLTVRENLISAALLMLLNRAAPNSPAFGRTSVTPSTVAMSSTQ